MTGLLRAAALMTIAGPALAGNGGVSIVAGQPGFYGRIDIGAIPQPPRLVSAEPVVIQPVPVGVVRQPLYLHVPPGHAKNWRKHCARYGACGQPVYFVQESWYNGVYVPYYRERYRGHFAPRPVAPTPVYAYATPPERYYTVTVLSVRAVIGAPEQRCWVERREIVEPADDGPNVPGAIVGAVIGGVLGHQVGGGRGRDVATAGGAVAGAAIGANVGRGSATTYSQDVQRCENVARQARPEYWDVTYRFRGVQHRVQLTSPPGSTITVDENGAPRV